MLKKPWLILLPNPVGKIGFKAAPDNLVVSSGLSVSINSALFANLVEPVSVKADFNFLKIVPLFIFPVPFTDLISILLQNRKKTATAIWIQIWYS